MTDTRVAIVGAGAMAREHIRAFADVPRVTVCGIHSRTREKAEKLAAGDALLFHVNQEHPKCFHSNGPFLGKLLFRRFAARPFVYVNISAL